MIYDPSDSPAPPDILDAVYDYVLTWVQPPLAPDHIYRGWQNRMALPPKDNEYAIIAVTGSARVGRNVHEYEFGPDADPGAGTLEIMRYERVQVQVDFFSDSESGFQRALCFEGVAGDDVGVTFFQDRGIDCLYAEDPQPIEHVDGSDSFVKRTMTVLHLGYWATVRAAVPSFDTVTPTIENVDVHHPPEE